MSLGWRRYRGIQVSEQRGIVLILFAAGTLAIVAMAGLALDLGMAYLTKTRLQNALDAAALSGARSLILYNSASLATNAAVDTFYLNLKKANMKGKPDPTVETSPTLTVTGFANGGPNLRFVRISVPALPVPTYFARVLPGVGETFDVGGTAVAGPEPLGNVCGALPMALCAKPGNTDSDCSDGECFGISPTSPLVSRELQLPFGDTPGNPQAGPGNPQAGPGNPQAGPGNYGLVQLGCGGGVPCVQQGMAGGRDFCFEPGGKKVYTQPGQPREPVAQGLNTRFGVYPNSGRVSSSTDYPPDVVTTSLLTYTQYLTALAAQANLGFPNGGVPQRRVAPILVIDCDPPPNGHQRVQPVGTACLFLTRQVADTGPGVGTIYGELVGTCLTSGAVSETPPPVPSAVQIVLYQNPSGA